MKERDGLNIMRRNERRAEMKEGTALSMLSGREHEAKTLQEAVEDSELLNFFHSTQQILPSERLPHTDTHGLAAVFGGTRRGPRGVGPGALPGRRGGLGGLGRLSPGPP